MQFLKHIVVVVGIATTFACGANNNLGLFGQGNPVTGGNDPLPGEEVNINNPIDDGGIIPPGRWLRSVCRSHGDSYGKPDGNANGDSDGFSDAFAHSYGDADTDTFTNSNGYADSVTLDAGLQSGPSAEWRRHSLGHRRLGKYGRGTGGHRFERNGFREQAERDG